MVCIVLFWWNKKNGSENRAGQPVVAVWGGVPGWACADIEHPELGLQALLQEDSATWS